MNSDAKFCVNGHKMTKNNSGYFLHPRRGVTVKKCKTCAKISQSLCKKGKQRVYRKDTKVLTSREMREFLNPFDENNAALGLL